jgi:hypothetical protein
MFHYVFLVASREVFGEPDCCKLFQTVAETELTAQIVADSFKLLQSVAGVTP